MTLEEIETELRENARSVLEETIDGNVDEETVAATIPDTELPVVRARLTNLPKLTLLKNLKSNLYGKSLSLEISSIGYIEV